MDLFENLQNLKIKENLSVDNKNVNTENAEFDYNDDDDYEQFMPTHPFDSEKAKTESLGDNEKIFEFSGLIPTFLDFTGFIEAVENYFSTDQLKGFYESLNTDYDLGFNFEEVDEIEEATSSFGAPSNYATGKSTTDILPKDASKVIPREQFKEDLEEQEPELGECIETYNGFRIYKGTDRYGEDCYRVFFDDDDLIEVGYEEWESDTLEVAKEWTESYEEGDDLDFDDFLDEDAKPDRSGKFGETLFSMDDEEIARRIELSNSNYKKDTEGYSSLVFSHYGDLNLLIIEEFEGKKYYSSQDDGIYQGDKFISGAVDENLTKYKITYNANIYDHKKVIDDIIKVEPIE